MNLDELRAVQVDERATDSLRPLADSFYRDAAAYLKDLREQRRRAASGLDDPFDSDEVRRLTDEIETAEEVVEAIYERRVGKVVKRASLAAAGMPADDEGLTDEESQLFADLVTLIESNRTDVLAFLEGDAGGNDEGSPTGSGTRGGAASSPAPDEPPPDQPDVAASDGPSDRTPGAEAGDRDDGTGGTADDTTPTETSGPGDGDTRGSGGQRDRLTVRITRDVGEILGVDERVYDLSAEDVVTLPAENAKPLLDRDAAERVDQ